MNYRPKLETIHVPLQKLLLDPNNPRFLEDHLARIVEANFADGGVQSATSQRMRRDAFKLDQLKKSIETNGWQPVDMIFVRKLKSLPQQYVVLEGNRRVMALRDLLEEKKLTDAVLKAVDPLMVLEVVGTGDLEESRAQITYLLGVRHHGSLKMWGPFAQAHNLYERYLQLGKMTDATFAWDKSIAERIGARLSVDVSKIEERIRVYRAMKQLHSDPKIRAIGMDGRYYSLVREALPPWKSNNPLKRYIVQDPTTFNLDNESVRRLDATCHFSTKDREGAPISRPLEWRPLVKILNDVDLEERAKMLREIEEEKKTPSEVSARRQAKLRQPRWDRWLTEVANLLKRLTIGNVDSEDARAKSVGTRLAKVLDSLVGPSTKKPAAKGS